MSKKPLERLKHGLKVFKTKISARRDEILARLQKTEPVPDADLEWLDGAGNPVEEQAVVDKLDNASDYERGITKLSDHEKSIVKRLLDGAVATVTKVINKKRKAPTEPVKKPKSTEPKKKAAPVFEKNENATLAQRIEILDWHHVNGANQSKTARHWNKEYPNLQLKQPTISRWVKDEQSWRIRWEEAQSKASTAAAGKVKRARQTQHPEIDEMLEIWVAKAMRDKVNITGGILREKWTQFADLRQIPLDDRINLSEGWLTRFKARVGLREFKRHGEAASANLEVVLEDQDRLRKLIHEHEYELRDIFNMDETGLFYAMPPDRGLALEQTSGVKGNKTRLTYALCMNADGSEKLEPFVIGHAFRPRCFKRRTGAELGFYYRHNAKAWMTGNLYEEWIKDWDSKLRAQDRKVMLLVDNFAGHLELKDVLTNIRVERFSPNITSHIQPADAGIIRCFKAHYRRLFNQRAIQRYDAEEVETNQIYKLDQLEAMQLAARAWREVDATTIRNCWRKTRILPTDSPAATVPTPSVANPALDNPAAEAEARLSQSIDALVAANALNTRNRLPLDNLLEERGYVGELNFEDDQDIHDAVMERRENEQNIDINGGDDGDTEQPESVPTRKETLNAMRIVQRYAAAEPSPTGVRVQEAMDAYTWDLRILAANNLRDTAITDFFTSRSA